VINTECLHIQNLTTYAIKKIEKEQRIFFWMFQLVDDYIIIGDLTWEVFN